MPFGLLNKCFGNILGDMRERHHAESYEEVFRTYLTAAGTFVWIAGVKQRGFRTSASGFNHGLASFRPLLHDLLANAVVVKIFVAVFQQIESLTKPFGIFTRDRYTVDSRSEVIS